MQLKLIEATFLKDTDTFGKQDPYLSFMYDDWKFKSNVAEDAGLEAKFNDVFELENIEAEIKKGGNLVMESYDKDVASDDALGEALAISYVKLIESNDEMIHDYDLYLDCKKTGNVKFSTQFVFVKPDPPPNPLLNCNCRLNVIIKTATFEKDADTFGKQDPFIKFMYNGKGV